MNEHERPVVTEAKDEAVMACHTGDHFALRAHRQLRAGHSCRDPRRAVRQAVSACGSILRVGQSLTSVSGRSSLTSVRRAAEILLTLALLGNYNSGIVNQDDNVAVGG